ncbi:hypothetical protein [Solidesulfovibrio alcoholivorans]|uniref:hypothetical protein n=1 Tax=Solidesulfovibrio alcoholivorans TaxID=81406 RepID=UPI0012EB378A|nr:hypothetical protein [Solidesulfovibrio alcoholivorans]
MDYDSCNIKLFVDTLCGTLNLPFDEVKMAQENAESSPWFIKSSATTKGYKYSYIYNNEMFVSIRLSSAGGNFRVKYFSRFLQGNTIDSIYLKTSEMFTRLGLVYSPDDLKNNLKFSEGHIAADIIGQGGYEATRIMQDAMSSLYNNNNKYTLRTTSRNEFWNYGSSENTEFTERSCGFKNVILKDQLIINQYDKLQEIIVHNDNNDYWYGLYSNFGSIDREVMTYIREAREYKDKAQLYRYCLDNNYGIFRLEFQIKREFFLQHRREFPSLNTVFDFLQVPATILKYILDKIFCICTKGVVSFPVEPYALIWQKLMEIISEDEAGVLGSNNGEIEYNIESNVRRAVTRRKSLISCMRSYVKEISWLKKNISGSFFNLDEEYEHLEEVVHDVIENNNTPFDFLDRFQG